MAGLLALGAAGLAACGDESNPRTLIQELRVLAIVADPPEVSHPSTSNLAPLVAGAEGEVRYEWSMCFVPGPEYAGYPCLDEAAELPLGEEETALALVPDLDPILASPEFEGFFIDLSEGIDVLARLTVTDETERSVQAVKSLRISEDAEPNANPEIEALTKDGADWPKDLVLEVNQDDELLLELVVDEATLQAYSEGGEEREEEALISWFASAGELDRERSDGEDPTVAWTVGGLGFEEWDGATDLEITLWAVLRDGRGGTDWTQRTVLVGPPGPP